MIEFYLSKVNEKTKKQSVYAKIVPPMELTAENLSVLLEKLGDSENPGCTKISLNPGNNPRYPQVLAYSADRTTDGDNQPIESIE